MLKALRFSLLIAVATSLFSSAAWANATCESLFKTAELLPRVELTPDQVAARVLVEKVDRVLWAPTARPFALKLEEDGRGAPQGYEGSRDRKSRSVIHLKRSRKNYAAHELLTAQSLGRFFESWRDAEFVFVTDFNGQTVPIYDGIAIDAITRLPLANVSLKSTIHHMNPTPHQFLADVKGRIDFHTDRTYMLRTPMSWFRATTGLLFRDVDVSKLPNDTLFEILDHPRRVADLFGLFGGGVHPGAPQAEAAEAKVTSRPTWLVVDYRKFGFSYHEATRRSVLNKLSALLTQQPDPSLELFLLWNAGHVIHVTREFVNVYEFTGP